MESNDRKNVYLSKNPDNSLNSGMRDTMIVNPGNIPPGKLCFISHQSIYKMILC